MIKKTSSSIDRLSRPKSLFKEQAHRNLMSVKPSTANSSYVRFAQSSQIDALRETFVIPSVREPVVENQIRLEKKFESTNVSRAGTPGNRSLNNSRSNSAIKRNPILLDSEPAKECKPLSKQVDRSSFISEKRRIQSIGTLEPGEISIITLLSPIGSDRKQKRHFNTHVVPKSVLELNRRYLRPVPDHQENPFNPITEGDPRAVLPTRGQGEQKVSDQYRESNDKKYLRPSEREKLTSLQHKELSMSKLLSGQSQPFIAVRTPRQESPRSIRKTRLEHLLNYDYAPNQFKKQENIVKCTEIPFATISSHLLAQKKSIKHTSIEIGQ